MAPTTHCEGGAWPTKTCRGLVFPLYRIPGRRLGSGGIWRSARACPARGHKRRTGAASGTGNECARRSCKPGGRRTGFVVYLLCRGPATLSGPSPGGASTSPPPPIFSSSQGPGSHSSGGGNLLRTSLYASLAATLVSGGGALARLCRPIRFPKLRTPWRSETRRIPGCRSCT